MNRSHLVARSLASAAYRKPLSNTASLYSQNKRTLSYVLDGFGGGGGGGGGSSSRWPTTKTNTIFNIVPQGHKYVVERFGKLHSIQDSGWFLAIPFVDQIAYAIDVRERAMDIPPQAAITRDNVSVEVSGNLFIKFQDAQAAAYGALNPLYSVTQVRYATLRYVTFKYAQGMWNSFSLLEYVYYLSFVTACPIGHAIGDWRNGT
jgi:hypothetical protein